MSRDSELSRREMAVVGALLGVQAFLLWLKIDAPFTEPAAYGRSCVNATIARNFFEQGMRFLYPQLDYGPLPGYAALEFPLIPYLAAMVYAVTGVHEWVGRAIPAVFGLGTSLVMWKIASEDTRSDVARIAAVLMVVLSPTFTFFSRVFQSDSAMIFFSALTLLLLLRAQRTHASGSFIAACVSCAVAMLLKPSSLVLMPAFASVLVFRGTPNLRRVVVLGVSTLVPVAAFYLFARAVNTYPETVGIDAVVARATFARMLQFNYDLQIAKDIFQSATPLGIVMMAVGLWFAVRRLETWYMPLWAAGAIVLDLVFNEALSHHEYYQIIWVPLAAMCAAQVFDAVAQGSAFRGALRTIAVAAAVVLLAGSAALTWRFLALRFQFPPASVARVTVARFVEAQTPPDALVGVEDIDLLYYAHRRGWPYGTDTAEPISKAQITTAQDKGIAFLAVQDESRLSAEARRYLDESGVMVARADSHAIWRLNGK
ncbi:MAG: glycosyltransferase family 39 protein [Vicinamibacterales bacterium]